MTAIVDAPAELDTDGDAVLEWLSEMLSTTSGLASHDGSVSDAVRIDRISMLERIKGSIAAVQAAEAVKFARSQVAAQRDIGVNPKRLGRGIAEQLGLATKLSGWHGARRLTLARDLVLQLPGTFDLLARGEISEYAAQLIAAETSHLDPETRGQVDRHLVAAGIERLAPKKTAGLARRLAYAADPTGSLRRASRARDDRRVGLRPAPDTMSWLGALLPIEQGVACFAALNRHTDAAKAAGDQRSRGQIMADTLVERLTGQATAQDIDVEVQITMPVDALLDAHSPAPSQLPGHGPLPAGLAEQIVGRTEGRRWWRRLFTAPSVGGNVLVGGDPSARQFTGLLARLIRARDQTCREPYCDAPIRHLDHVQPFRDGGATAFANGRGVCERHNYAREMPGWVVTVLQERPHTVETSTPTGHRYRSRAPD